MLGGCSDDTDPVQDMGPALDGSASDGSGDTTGKKGVSGDVKLASSVSCGSAKGNDCKGTFVVIAVDKPAAPPTSKLLGFSSKADADFSGGKKLSYSIENVSASECYVVAVLYESGGAAAGSPKPGDMISSYAKIKVPGTASLELQRLPARDGGAGVDGKAADGAGSDGGPSGDTAPSSDTAPSTDTAPGAD